MRNPRHVRRDGLNTMNDTAAQDAETLRAAAAIMRRYFGGLGTAIAVLDEKAQTLTQYAKES